MVWKAVVSMLGAKAGRIKIWTIAHSSGERLETLARIPAIGSASLLFKAFKGLSLSIPSTNSAVAKCTVLGNSSLER
jgi:hypothetical protein